LFFIAFQLFVDVTSGYDVTSGSTEQQYSQSNDEDEKVALMRK
jgi:hypothetical protein